MKKLILITTYTLFWRNFLKVIIGLKYYNQEILRKKKQFILIANHNSHMDTMAIMSSMPSRYIHRVHPVAAEDFFGGSRFKEILMRYMVNAILIPRKIANSEEDVDPIEVMSNLLKKGRSIIIYPEGSRGDPGTMTNFKKGIGYLVKQNPTVDVIPVYLDGLHRTLPKGKNLILPYNCRIIFGDSINFDSFDLEEIINTAEKAIHKVKSLVE
ncbi:MAG: 1-acyl-sn-glycerol-3-phosphate acyltransferase [Flavobacteriales bacterium]|jgi:1-acyl-sn-glycerol-3-phosphate acyltransferase|nr:1-acyl-sn-glycerol-3-phosphate acyltransferase [Flavobacteriales bacterium]MBT5089705.1 1-acyl-sn-glycerol-3-phosphate acyltransferase [Flavobacteriales bacterium]MBT5749813.1 1-acyl-sn-glycerol-3-phosphate acyltransferase [Flavobacteriales bacterium]